MKPLVTVVIPTRGRPHLVPRAARSALSQTLQAIEVVVVLDGPDPATRAALVAIGDPRLRLVERPTSGGASAARNTGVAAAAAEWVSFLDDDDEWFPDKLEAQLEAARAVVDAPVVVACRLQFRLPGESYDGPRRLPRDGEEVSAYLLDRRTLFREAGTVLTSMLLARRETLLQMPFAVGISPHEDADWVLRAASRLGAKLVYVERVLGVWHGEGEGERLSASGDWQRSLAWIRSVAGDVTPRAYAGFVLSDLSACAARAGVERGFRLLLREALANGSPRLRHVALHCAMWSVPEAVRRRLRRSWSSGQDGSVAGRGAAAGA